MGLCIVQVLSFSKFLPFDYLSFENEIDVAIGVPVVLGRNGVERIVELRLNLETRTQFENSASLVRSMIKKIRS